MNVDQIVEQIMEQDLEQIMWQVCDNCHWPYVEADQDAMDARCAACPIEAAIRRLAGMED